jgi:hypothetical protein
LKENKDNLNSKEFDSIATGNGYLFIYGVHTPTKSGLGIWDGLNLRLVDLKIILFMKFITKTSILRESVVIMMKILIQVTLSWDQSIS